MQRYFFLLFVLEILVHSAIAQDTLTLINGKVIIVKSVDIRGNSIAYRKFDKPKGLKSVDPENVFSIRYQDGTEQIIFQQDSLDPLDFTVEEMRMFIKGEQDAAKYYKNNVVKSSAFLVGAGASLLGFYGLAIPPLYATVLGSFSPNMEKQQVSDPALLKVNEYREGYERKVRDRKIRNSMICGMIGFVAGIITFNVIY